MVLVSNVAYITHEFYINQNHLPCVPWTTFYYDFLYIAVFDWQNYTLYAVIKNSFKIHH